MKRGYRHRCMAVRNGSRCWTRLTMRHRADTYAPGRCPRCPQCGSRGHWYWDRYRDTRELDAQLCRCPAAPYPHRRGTAASGGRFGAWACEAHVPF